MNDNLLIMKDRSDKMNKNGFSRREFIGRAAALSSGLAIVSATFVSGLGHRPPSDTLNIAGVCVGGRAATVLRALDGHTNIVVLCDVDCRYSQDVFDEYPNAKRYWDWRKMFDEMGDDIDGVMVATSDHTHAIIAAHAMTLGKHVYEEEPLPLPVYESS